MPRRPRRHSSGRQRVPMRRMENESNLQVTFSKRRLGIFKKASELVTLCAAELAIILFSPGQKAFSFGHPSVDEIIDRFLSGIHLPAPSWPTNQLMEVQQSPSVVELNEQLTNTLATLEAESQRGATLDYDRSVSQSIRRLEAPIEELRMDELEQLRAAMENLNVNIGHQIEFFMHQQEENPAAFQPGPSYFGSGGGEGSSSFGGGGAGPSSFGGEVGGAGPSSYGGGGGSAGPRSFGGEVGGSSFVGGFSYPPGPSSFGEGPSHFRSGGASGALAFFGGPSSSRGDGNDLPPFPTRLSPFGGAGGSDIPPEGPSFFGGGDDIGLPPFPPSFFEGGGGSGLSLFPIGPSSFGAGGGALPYPPPPGFFGLSSGGDSPFSTGPSSLSGGGASPFSPWLSSSRDGSIFPGESSSFGHGGTGSATSLPPPPISFGHGVVLPFPHEPSSFRLGGGNGDSGSLPIFPLGPSGVTPFPLGPSGSGGGLPLPPGPSFYEPDSGLPFRSEPGSYGRGGPPYLRPSTSFGRSRSRGRGRGRAPLHFDPRAPILRGPRGRRGRGHEF